MKKKERYYVGAVEPKDQSDPEIKKPLKAEGGEQP